MFDVAVRPVRWSNCRGVLRRLGLVFNIVQGAKIALRTRMPLRGRFAVPLSRLGCISRHTYADIEQQPASIVASADSKGATRCSP